MNIKIEQKILSWGLIIEILDNVNPKIAFLSVLNDKMKVMQPIYLMYADDKLIGVADILTVKINQLITDFQFDNDIEIQSDKDIYVFNILEIKKQYRNKGFGSVFVMTLLKRFEGNTILALSLKETKRFWNQLGFNLLENPSPLGCLWLIRT